MESLFRGTQQNGAQLPTTKLHEQNIVSKHMDK